MTALFQPARLEERAVIYNKPLFGDSQTSAAGTNVTNATALSLSTVFTCVRIISEDVARLPFILYERQANGGRMRYMDHPVYQVLRMIPNPELSAFELWEMAVQHLLLRGVFYAEIVRDSAGRAESLWPLHPDKMTVEQDQSSGRYRYIYQLPDHSPATLARSQVLHIRGIMSDGQRGVSVITAGRESMGLAMATEKYGAKLFQNGARPGGLLIHPGRLSPEARKNIGSSWSTRYGGIDNAHKIAILEEGLTYHQLGMTPDDAQFLATRRFQKLDIAALFRVPPHKVNELDRATHTNIEQQQLDYVSETLGSWMSRIEQSVQRDVLSPPERTAGLYAEFLLDGLLRGDTQSRYSAYAVARQNGWMSANDIRQKENMSPISGGDVYLVPMNMVPADQAGQVDGGAPPAVARAETRAQAPKQVAIARQRLGRSQRIVIADVLARILRREANDIGNAYKRMSRAEFTSWLATFFEGHHDFIVRQMSPAMLAYSQMVAEQVSQELDEQVNQDWSHWVESYLGGFAARHIGRSQMQLDTALENPEQADNQMDQLLEAWRQTRALSQAAGESTRFHNALALAAYTSAGVVKKRWNTIGDSCPYCKAKDGLVVEISGPFFEAGDQLEAEGHEPLKITKDVRHPQAHNGCDCVVTASV